MSPVVRKAVSRRMNPVRKGQSSNGVKAYWKKRRAEVAKEKGKSGP